MAGVMLETPSRIWRRIEAEEDDDMPSLPPVPAFEDSASSLHSNQQKSDSVHPSDESDPIHASDESLPFQSTPAVSHLHHQTASTVHPPSSSSSAVRFAHSVAISHSSKSASSASHSQARFGGSASLTRQSPHDTFEVSEIRPIAEPGSDSSDGEYGHAMTMELAHSRESIPRNGYTPSGPLLSEEELDLTEALEDINRSHSPFQANELEDRSSPKSGKYYDYSVSLQSEPKPSPLGTKSSRFANVSFRKPLDRTRTPSLTRTTTSLASSGSSNSTPHSTGSIAIERPRTASPLQGGSVLLPRSASYSPSATPGPSSAHPYPYNQEDSVSDDLRSSDGLPDSGMSENRSLQRHDVSTIPEVRESDLESEGDQELQEQLSSRDVDAEEQTFFPEETPHASPSTNMKSPAFSSPAVSAVFTPTPAFAPKARARFQIISLTAPSQEEEEEEMQDSTEREDMGGLELATPNAHKRSFLMEVINSTTRPRFKFPTPHPNHIGETVEATPEYVTETSAPPSAVRLNSAFAGITSRRPGAAITKPRLSHPLAQAWTATESESDHQPSDSPYDPLAERASFVSTASSHDLTTFYARANASFDPVIGLGAQGTGIGRFNAGKLNTYLHGLNKVLEEENKALVERLKKLEEERSKGSPSSGSAISMDSAAIRNRLSAGGRRGRVSMSPGAELGNVEEEDEGAEWMEEKAEMENIIQGLQEELKKSSEEKEDVITRFEDERAERTRDKERWRERMGEVERGVEEIVKDLEAKLGDAESRAILVDETAQRLREAEKEVERVEDEKDEAFRRAENAERALASGEDLGAELNAANEQIGKLTAELKSANHHVQEMDQRLRDVTSRADHLEKELKEENEMVDGLDQELQARLDELDIARKQVDTLKKEAKGREEELQATKAYVTELEEDTGAAADRIEILEGQLGSTQNKLHETMAEVEELHQRADKLEAEADRGNELARQMEEALEAAEQKMRVDEEEVAELKGVVASLKREKEKEQSKSVSRVVEPSQDAPNADDEALEIELDEAHREIARLKAQLNQSPARKAVEKAKDSKIKMLEKERDDLLERVRQFKASTLSNTPNRLGMNDIKVTPLHRRIISLMSPKTPGGPLRDMSWLNSTINDPSVSPLISEIARLQRELDQANESIDEKLEQLEDAGFSVVGLTQQLEDARSHISNLEDEIARLSRKDDRRTRRMQKMRCLKCRTKIDFKNIDADESLMESSNLSLATEPATPPTKTSEALRANLQAVNQQLVEMKRQWREEKKQLLGEKAVLQDAASRLNIQIRNAQAEVARIAETERAGQKARASVQGELDKAREAVAALEAELKDERTRLRELTAEQGRVERQKKNVLTQLQRTESDMEDVKASLQRVKEENHQLEDELRTNAIVEQKARHLEHKVAENAATIERLRQERSLLARDHKDLQKKYSEAAEHVNTLREQYKASQATHDHRRHDLDMHLFEIEDLRRALTQKESELERVETEKNRASMEKNDFIKTVKALEADLVRVRKDAERFGNDLKALKKEKDKLEEKRRIECERTERGEKQLKARMRILSDEIQGEREKWKMLNEQWRTHVCAVDEEELVELKMQHKQECKGLIVQIKYLKAKFTRESCLRCDLGYQKKYLLVLLARFERTENKILASIARIGFAVDPSSNPAPITRSRPEKKTFKSVVTGIMFVCRAKRASELWHEHCANRQAVTEALQDVRRKRAAAAAVR